MIVAAPTASGSSAATRLRKTKNESRKRIGNASSSARAMSSETCSPTCSWASSPPPSGHARHAREPLLHASSAPLTSSAERPDHVGGAAVLRHQRAVAAALVARRRSRSPGPRTPARPARACACACAESAGAPSRTSATMSGDGARAGRALDVAAREHRLRLRVVEVVLRSRAARTPGRRRSPRPARPRASPTGSGGAGGGSRGRAGRASSSRGGRFASSSIVMRLDPAGRPLLARREHLEVERRDHVQQHPAGEERPQLRRLGARRLADLAHEVGVALAHPRLDLGIGDAA